jgi:Flp pilus assembly pilin Flp
VQKTQDVTPASHWLDTRGSITLEYAIIVGFTALLISTAIVSLGVPLVSGYNHARKILVSPNP